MPLRVEPARQHEPGLDPDTERQLPAAGECRCAGEVGHLAREVEGAGHGRLGVAAYGSRVAEAGEHAVALVARHVTAMPGDHCAAALAVSDEERGVLLRVEPGREHA